MGEVLAHKRQTVVDRLRRRFDHYRRHHNACLPRYEQSTDGLFEKHRQETLMLKQRHLESKAKKAKTGKNNNSSEHHKNTIIRDTVSDPQKLLSHSKPVKRPREHSPVISMPPEISSDDLERSTKIIKPSNYESNPSSEHHYKKSSPSILLTQQKFPSNCHNSKIKTQQFSPKASNVNILDSCAGPSVEGKDLTNLSHPDGPASLSLKCQSETSIIPNMHSEEITECCDLLSKTAECKQEKEQKNDSTLCQFPGDSINYSANLEQNQDRLSDTFPSIGGLAEDSCDDVLHPDILKDLFDDVFTNSPDMMDFFGDSVGSIRVGDEDDANKNDVLMKSSSPYQSTVDKLTFSVNHQVDPQQPSGLHTNALTIVSTPLTSTKTIFSTVPSTSESASKIYTHSSQQCLPLFNSLSTSHQLPESLSIDFKLIEPIPAALTLKQMAEQHQNMQQKQQLGRSLESSNRMTFSADPFSDPVSLSFRNRFFLNGNNSASKSSNSSVSLFNSAALVSERKYSEIESLSAFKEQFYSKGQLDSSQRCLLMRPSGHAEQKSPCAVSTRLGWALESNDPPNTASHPIDSQYLTEDNKPQVDENHIMSLGFGTRTVQQVKAVNSDIIQQEEVVPQPYYNMFTAQHNDSSISNSVFSAAMPLAHNMSYNTNFASAMGRLPSEYKLDQPNIVSRENQKTIQTSAAYQQTYIGQRAHNQSLNNQWRHVQLPQNSLNIENYEHNGAYRQLPSHGNQLTATTNHHNANYPYSGANGHGQVTRQNFPLINQPRIQQLNSQFHQRQQLPAEHRLMSAQTETTSHISASMYNISQDNNHINLDFLGNIHSNASDLLNFDQVLHNETDATFQLMG